MSEPRDDATEERLRAVLRAEAGSVDPSPEALSAIRTRTQRGSTWFTALLGASWLRPSLAVGAAAVIAGSVLLGTPQVRDQILPQSLTTPTEQENDPSKQGGGAPGEDQDDVSGKSTPEPGDPADKPTGGAPPSEGDPAEPEETDAGAAPFGTTDHCAPGTPPTHAPAPSGAPGTTTSTPPAEPGAATTECDPTDDPTVPTDEPSDEVPGDGNGDGTDDSTPPPGNGGGNDTPGNGGGAPTTGPENNSSGNTGAGTTALRAD